MNYNNIMKKSGPEFHQDNVRNIYFNLKWEWDENENNVLLLKLVLRVTES